MGRPQQVRILAFSVLLTSSWVPRTAFQRLTISLLTGTAVFGHEPKVRLLLRLYESQAGRISVSGIDIQELTQKSLREEIGIVSQQTVLFNDTLMYNIRYSKPEATREEVMEAARIAALEDFIEEQPKGLETIVGERGVKLSGGQLQRVGIARALLKNASILLLDEATAALDSVTGKPPIPSFLYRPDTQGILIVDVSNISISHNGYHRSFGILILPQSGKSMLASRL